MYKRLAVLIVAPILWIAIAAITIILFGVLVAGFVFWIATAGLVFAILRAAPTWTRPEPVYVAEMLPAGSLPEQSTRDSVADADDRVSATQ